MNVIWIVALVVAAVMLSCVCTVAVVRRSPGAVPAAGGAIGRGELDRLRESMARSHGALHAQLQSAVEQTASLASTTGALREVLASPRARGQWGERTADDVLRVSGLIEHVSYVRQRATPHGTVPDVTFLLPGGRMLHMDVKFPIDNYVRHLEAGTDDARAAFADAFRRDVRARIRELEGRGYVDPANGTLDYMVAFLPNESVYAFVHEHDPGLVDEALGRKVVLCSPSTLFAVLAVVRQAAEASGLERTSGEVLEVLGIFTHEWDRYCDALDRLGRTVDAVERAYGELAGTRRRALERPIARVEELRKGVRNDGEPLRLVSDKESSARAE
jgi:DNA recombination protein RmuC